MPTNCRSPFTLRPAGSALVWQWNFVQKKSAVTTQNVFCYFPTKKNNSTEDGIDGTIGFIFSGGILAVPRIRKPPEFRSEPFRGRDKCSEDCTVEQKKKQASVGDL